MEEIAVDYRELAKRAYDKSPLKDQLSFRDYEKACAFQFLSCYRMLRNPIKKHCVYRLPYLGSFVPEIKQLYRSFFVNRKRREEGSMTKEEYTYYQRPLVYLLRKLGLNPLVKSKLPKLTSHKIYQILTNEQRRKPVQRTS